MQSRIWALVLPFETQNQSYHGNPLLGFLIFLVPRVFSKKTPNFSSFVVGIRGKSKKNVRRFENFWERIIKFCFGMKWGKKRAKKTKGSVKNMF